MVTRLSPSFLSVDAWRDVVNNNTRIDHVRFVLHTGEKWLPKVLSEAGFFASNSQVKKNRPDLWRELDGTETITLRWAEICIVHDTRLNNNAMGSNLEVSSGSRKTRSKKKSVSQQSS